MNVLVVFARVPELGKVKTRLAAQLGKEAALQIYVALLRDTLKVAKDATQKGVCEAILAYTPTNALENDFTNQKAGKNPLTPFWQGNLIAQSGDDLGERMKRAIDDTLARSATRVLIIGSDKPDLEVSLLSHAFDELAKHDLVFGPAHDGGFYLIGTHRALPAPLFDNVTWSSHSTLQSVLDNARDLGLSVALLPPGSDVDELDDLRNLSNASENNATHTRATLRHLKLF